MPTVKEGKHILKPNADPRAARFRSVIRLYLEVLEAGSLDENLIPEIEGVFKEVGALAGLDFETIRKQLEVGDKKKKGGRPPLKSDAQLVADLPDPFTWKDVGEVGSYSTRPAASKRLAKLVDKNLVYAAGPGSYRVSGRSIQTSPERSIQTSPEPSLETKTLKTGKSEGKETSLQTPSPVYKPQSLQTPNLAASYPKATGDPATMARADFIPNTGYQAILRSTYFDGETKKASSRTSPQVPLGLVVGSWRIDDDFKGLHGHEISQLREVLLADLITSELDEFGRVEPAKRADVRRFEHWLEQGREAPPIEVVETNKEKLNHAAWSHDQAVFFST